MISRFNSVAIFAEDNRAEEQGTNTLVGIMPDNANFLMNEDNGGVPTLPRLVIYVRSSIPVATENLTDLTVKFKSPSGKLIAQNPVEASFIEEQIAESKSQGSPQTTIISQFSMSPFPILEQGQFLVIVEFAGEDFLSGFINFRNSEGMSDGIAG